jgi:hypothetical protein
VTTTSRRWCCSCLDWRPAEEFRDEVVGKCKKCVSAAARAWRELNPEAVAEYNERRRIEYRDAHPLPTRPCAVCGELFSKRPDALVCSPACREKRKEQRRLRRKAAA